MITLVSSKFLAMRIIKLYSVHLKTYFSCFLNLLCKQKNISGKSTSKRVKRLSFLYPSTFIKPAYWPNVCICPKCPERKKPKSFLARVSCNNPNSAKKCYGKNQRCHTHCQKMKMNGKKQSKF